jgi:hypothetical protein
MWDSLTIIAYCVGVMTGNKNEKDIPNQSNLHKVLLAMKWKT